MKLLAEMEPGSVDGLITDPPYSSGGLHSIQRKGTTSDKYISSSGNGISRFADPKFNFHGDNKDQRSYMRWVSYWLSDAFTALKEGAPVAIFCDWRQIPVITDAFQWSEFLWLGIFVWDKKNARPHLGKFRQSTEFVVWGAKGKLNVDKKKPIYLPGMVSASIPNSQHRHHQTEKPQALMRELVKIVPEGGVVLDPFMGSGSTGVAALAEGRQFIGIEKSDYYFQVAKNRLFID